MPLSDRALLEHIRDACRDIARDASNLSVEALGSRGNPLRNSILYSLITIGEAVNQLSPALRDRYPRVPWRRIVDFRNQVTHRYFALDPSLLHETITVHLPELLDCVETMIEHLPPGED